jgi:uncharacterized protein
MKTLVLGASTKPDRYSHKAALRLLQHGHDIVLIGVQQGEIQGQAILNGEPDLFDIDTVTMYINPARQTDYYDYLLGLQPRRIIFNPGTENLELAALAAAKGIQTEEACTLVLLATGAY